MRARYKTIVHCAVVVVPQFPKLARNMHILGLPLDKEWQPRLPVPVAFGPGRVGNQRIRDGPIRDEFV